MLDECITAARASGIDRVELEVRTDNRRALELSAGGTRFAEAVSRGKAAVRMPAAPDI